MFTERHLGYVLSQNTLLRFRPPGRAAKILAAPVFKHCLDHGESATQDHTAKNDSSAHLGSAQFTNRFPSAPLQSSTGSQRSSTPPISLIKAHTELIAKLQATLECLADNLQPVAIRFIHNRLIGSRIGGKWPFGETNARHNSRDSGGFLFRFDSTSRWEVPSMQGIVRLAQTERFQCDRRQHLRY